MTRLEAAVHDLDAQRKWNSTDGFKPHSFHPIGVKPEIHREDAKTAKKISEPAHKPLTMRLMPSFVLFIASFLRALCVFAVRN